MRSGSGAAHAGSLISPPGDSYSEYERLSRVPSLGWLLANSPIEEGDLPERRRPARALRRGSF